MTEELDLQKDDVVIVEGLLTLKIKDGKVTISGGLHEEGEKITIPKAKSVPLEARTEAIIEYEKKEGGKIERLSERTIPQDWDPAIDEIIEKEPKRITILGKPDTGKTFFSTYLTNRLLNNDIKSAIVDTDAGQSDIGPPGTIGLGLLKSPMALLSEVPAHDSYFIGSMSPSGHMLEFMVGMKRMSEIGLRNADIVIVDTPGWVVGGAGRSLQHFGAELIDPDFVIGLQREEELEHLLKTVPGEVRRVSVSEKVRSRTRQERSELRHKGLSDYFKGSREISLNLEEITLERCYLGTGDEINPKDLDQDGVVYAEKIQEGLILVTKKEPSENEIQKLSQEFGKVNLLKPGDEKYLFTSLVGGRKRKLIGVGSIEKIDYSSKEIKIITPVENGGKIDRIQLGSMKITPSGEEVGTVRPGTF